MFPMGLLANGERAEVVNGIPAPGHGHGPCCGDCRGKGREGAAVRLEDMGIRPGKEVEMLNNGGGGALLVKVDDSRIAVKSYNLSLRKREAEEILLEVPK